MVRYATLYFLLLILFVGMIAGPVAYSNKDKNPKFLKDIFGSGSIGSFHLLQPNNQSNNDTLGSTPTGRAAGSATGKAAPSPTDTKVRLF